MDRNDAGFQFRKRKSPNISDSKRKECIFFGPHIRKLRNDYGFEKNFDKSSSFLMEII